MEEIDNEMNEEVEELENDIDELEALNSKANDVKERLLKAWSSGNIHEAFGILVEDMRPWYIRWLLNRFPSFSVDDAEECFGDAIASTHSRDPETVNNIYRYLFTCVRRNAIDQVKERKPFVRLDPEWIEAASDESLLSIAEVALDEELTVRVDQLRQLYELTLPKLSPNRQRLTLLLLEGPGLTNEELAEIMEMTKDALKSLKSRTLADLRRLLPVSAEELGLDFNQVLNPPPEVFEVRPFLPSEDNGDGGE